MLCVNATAENCSTLVEKMIVIVVIVESFLGKFVEVLQKVGR